MHHIIDPATDLPVIDTWRTVSVAAATCTDANIATTAALVRGLTAPAWLRSLGLPARLVDWDGHITTVGRWPEDSTGASATEAVHEARRTTTA
jgi:thiamine biosynthesis lipoprotein